MHRNKINNKVYIGQTCQKPEHRWGANGNGYREQQKFYNAIQKYGWNNFEHIILEECDNEKEALNRESYYIQKYDSINNGYNILSHGIESANKINQKPVYCLTTKILYPSITQAAYENDTDASRIIENCKGKNGGTKGLQWAYWDVENNTYIPPIPFERKIPKNAIKIYCIELDTYYPSIAEAARQLHIDVRAIEKAVRGERNGAYGKHFIKIDDIQKKNNILLKQTGKNRKVFCLDNQQIFNSLQDAAIFCNRSSQSVMLNCQNKRKSCGGYHFIYYEDYIKKQNQNGDK